MPCDLFGGPAPGALERMRRSKVMYAPLCDGRLYLRNPGAGHRTGLEAATEFLRERVLGGEAAIGLGHQLLSDANRETAAVGSDASAAAAARARADGPAPAQIDRSSADQMLSAPGLGIGVTGAPAAGLAPGAWYAGPAGSFISIIQPGLVDPVILRSGGTAADLDSVEASSICFLVAFDLDRFRLGYARGTTHPALGWSAHMPDDMRDPQLKGPDGIDTASPLVSTGLVAPYERPQVLATFTGGFKREHGAFLYGDLARVNHASHYGFIEHGVVFSRLQPGLATIIVRDDGAVDLKTWSDSDNATLAHVAFARQNGVPIVEADPAARLPMPGRLVTQWGAGNWSGTQARRLRTMRSAMAIQIVRDRRYLIYAVFSSATPSAMVRVFQAYGCRYAMLLDMNALEHTYFAFYRPDGDRRSVEYLIRGMQEVDTLASTRGSPVLRFIDYADNRDFFYVLRRDEAVRPGADGGRP